MMESEDRQSAEKAPPENPPTGTSETGGRLAEGSSPAPASEEVLVTPAPATTTPEATSAAAPEPPPEDVDPEIERATRMFEIQKTMGEAARLSSMRSSTIRGRAFKVRARDDSMAPVIQNLDLLHIGPATLMKLKSGDLLYFHVQEEYRVRRLVRRTAVADGLAFAVRTDASDKEELVTSNQILGKVVSLERGLETIHIEKKGKAGGGRIDFDTLVEKVAPFLQRAIDKVKELVQRFRTRKKS